MRRREFITLLGSAAAAWPLAARAQKVERMRRVSLLIGIARDQEGEARVAAFIRALEELGWAEGRNVTIEYRWAGGDADRMRSDAAAVVRSAPDVIVANGTTLVPALMRETNTVPVVFLIGVDPIDAGFVTNLARPGGNMTAFTTFEPGMGGKWLTLIKEIDPRITRVSVMMNPTTAAPHSTLYFHAIEKAGGALNVQPARDFVHNADEIERAVAAIGRELGGGLIVMPDSFTTTQHKVIIEAAVRQRVPAIYPFPFFAKAGGLMCYGVSVVELFRQSASYVDRILKGTKVGDLPIQQPTKFDLVINLKTAKTLGLTVPPSLLARADEMIE